MIEEKDVQVARGTCDTCGAKVKTGQVPTWQGGSTYVIRLCAICCATMLLAMAKVGKIHP